MATLEEKIELIMEYIVAGDAETESQLKEKIKQALCEVEPVREDHTLDNIIDDFLTEIGMPCHLVGYSHVVTAFKMIIVDPTYLNNITDRLYVQIAEQHDSTYTRVERAIRSAIEKAWDRMSFDTMDRLFGSIGDPGKGKPTNSEFLAVSHKIISRRLRDLK